jgi:GT2 family glycosyltransferase
MSTKNSLIQEKTKTELVICILNWNGWQDTIECLTSLLESTFMPFRILLIENGSTDNSLQMIQSWADKHTPHAMRRKGNDRVNILSYDLAGLLGKTHPVDARITGEREDIILVKSTKNLGFARGSNAGIRIASQFGFKNILLLNNDTTVEKKCLETLMQFLRQHPEYDIITPKIYNFHKPDTIWNCGGKLTWTGSRKYYFRDRTDTRKTEDGYRDITFITGCALLVRTKIFQQYGLLSQKFFFGEEDYEFSRRMKKHSVKMAAVLPAKVFHKIGGSLENSATENPLDKHIIFYLNRFIDLKQFYPRVYWRIWRWFALCYILPMLKMKYSIGIKKLFHFGSFILTFSMKKNEVSADDFCTIQSLQI